MPYPNLTLMHWAPLLAAGATLAAVFVALFRESSFLRLRRPRLQAQIRARPPDCNKTRVRVSPELIVDSYYLRIWITNSGRSTATRVQVFAARLERRHADGQFHEESFFLPMNLLWSHTGAVYADGIAPEMGQHCDFGIIFPPAVPAAAINRPDRIPAGRTCLQLETEVRPFTGSSHLEPGDYRLWLRIAASNAKPGTVSVRISLTGDWFDDENQMLSHGVGVSIAA
jgi:hypothetical protein